MTPTRTQRERVLAEAVVSAYINELSPRERPSRRPERELARAPRVARVRERLRQRRELVAA